MSDPVETPGADLDLRRLRYFLATATALNFGRAARTLHIAQPVLTRQIRVLETELGVTLFDRSSRGTRLTPDGAALVEEARTLLLSAQALQRRVRRNARAAGRVSIGFMPGIVPTALVHALRERFPALAVDVLRTSWDDQVEVVLDGRADLSLVRLPIDRRGVTVTPAFSEPRVAVLARTHPLAERDAVTLEDLVGVPLLQDPAAVPELLGTRAAAQAQPQATVEEKLERVAIDHGAVVLPESTARFYTRADVVVRPVAGLAPSEVALVRAEGHTSPVIEAAVELAAGWDALGT